MKTARNIQSIVICPTRELCLQIATDIQKFAKFINHKTVAVYGGTSIDGQIRDIKRGAQVIIGTPGRTVDLINRRVLENYRMSTSLCLMKQTKC